MAKQKRKSVRINLPLETYDHYFQLANEIEPYLSTSGDVFLTLARAYAHLARLHRQAALIDRSIAGVSSNEPEEKSNDT